MPKRKVEYKPDANAKRPEDYEPGTTKSEIFEALKKVVLANPTATNEQPDPASSVT